MQAIYFFSPCSFFFFFLIIICYPFPTFFPAYKVSKKPVWKRTVTWKPSPLQSLSLPHSLWPHFLSTTHSWFSQLPVSRNHCKTTFIFFLYFVFTTLFFPLYKVVVACCNLHYSSHFDCFSAIPSHSKWGHVSHHFFLLEVKTVKTNRAAVAMTWMLKTSNRNCKFHLLLHLFIYFK